MRLFELGPGEWLLVGLIALLLFGRKIPDVMRHIGGMVLEFRDGISFERRLTPRDRYEAEKRTEELSRRMDRFGRAVLIILGVFVLAVIVAFLLRD